VPFQGPKKSRFSEPTPSNAPRNDVALLKTITYRAIKITGTLIVILLTFARGLRLYVRRVLGHLDLRVQPGNLTGARLAEGQRREQAVTQPHLVIKILTVMCKVMINFRQYWGSGSGLIGIILADADPYLIQSNAKPNYTFYKIRTTIICSFIENYDTYDAAEKDETILTDTAVNESHQISYFPTWDPDWHQNRK
jgi:hypothetical protein